MDILYTDITDTTFKQKVKSHSSFVLFFKDKEVSETEFEESSIFRKNLLMVRGVLRYKIQENIKFLQYSLSKIDILEKKLSDINIEISNMRLSRDRISELLLPKKTTKCIKNYRE